MPLICTSGGSGFGWFAGERVGPDSPLAEPCDADAVLLEPCADCCCFTLPRALVRGGTFHAAVYCVSCPRFVCTRRGSILVLNPATRGRLDSPLDNPGCSNYILHIFLQLYFVFELKQPQTTASDRDPKGSSEAPGEDWGWCGTHPRIP